MTLIFINGRPKVLKAFQANSWYSSVSVFPMMQRKVSMRLIIMGQFLDTCGIFTKSGYSPEFFRCIFKGGDQLKTVGEGVDGVEQDRWFNPEFIIGDLVFRRCDLILPRLLQSQWNNIGVEDLFGTREDPFPTEAGILGKVITFRQVRIIAGHIEERCVTGRFVAVCG